jgi:hypothetical protein
LGFDGRGSMTLLVADELVPELGQVVWCRDRVWAVNEVSPSALPPDPIAGTRPQHLVRMSSIEDDGFGDELSVIWELEAGTRVIPHQELPELLSRPVEIAAEARSGELKEAA